MVRIGRRRMVVAAVSMAVVLALGAGPATAEEDSHFAADFGLGVGALFTNVIYMPVKLVYATLGGITGGFAYVLTGFNYDLAKAIWVPSTGGDYVITPSMLKGDDPIYFSGETRAKHSSHARDEDLGTDRKRDADSTSY
jgi:hypothetical protein